MEDGIIYKHLLNLAQAIFIDQGLSHPHEFVTGWFRLIAYPFSFFFLFIRNKTYKLILTAYLIGQVIANLSLKLKVKSLYSSSPIRHTKPFCRVVGWFSRTV